MSALTYLNTSDNSGTKVTMGEIEELDSPPNSFKVTTCDIGGLLYSIIFYFVSLGSDLYLAYTYYITGKYTYFLWTIGFILIPNVIVTRISLKMYILDSNDSCIKKHVSVRIAFFIVGVFLQLAPFIRYCNSFFYAVKSLKAESNFDKKQQKKYYNKMLNEDSDVALLRVFICYLKAAPQQVLQISLLLIEYSYGSELYMIKQFIIIIVNFIAMGLCMSTYHRCIRFDQSDKKNISILGAIFVFFWHMNVTVSRILALSAIASINPFWGLIVVAHWLGMTIWVAVTSKTSFCGNNAIDEFLFSCAIGLVYIFNFLNLKDGPTRKSYFIFYGSCFVENLVLSVMWAFYSFLPIQNWLNLVFVVLPTLTLIIGITCLLIYYKFLHPNKRK